MRALKFFTNIITVFIINSVAQIIADMFFPNHAGAGILLGVLVGMAYIILDTKRQIKKEEAELNNPLESINIHVQNQTPKRKTAFETYFEGTKNVDIIKTTTYVEQNAMLQLLEKMKYENLKLEPQIRGRIKYFYINTAKEVFDMNDRSSPKKVLYKSSTYNINTNHKLVL